MAKTCELCGKRLGLFEHFNSSAKSDGVQICDACYHSYWEKQEDEEKQALSLARLVRDRAIEGPLKTTIVKRIRQLHPGGVVKKQVSDTNKEADKEKKTLYQRRYQIKHPPKKFFFLMGRIIFVVFQLIIRVYTLIVEIVLDQYTLLGMFLPKGMLITI